jgi:hypothetical protein
MGEGGQKLKNRKAVSTEQPFKNGSFGKFLSAWHRMNDNPAAQRGVSTGLSRLAAALACAFLTCKQNQTVFSVHINAKQQTLPGPSKEAPHR